MPALRQRMEAAYSAPEGLPELQTNQMGHAEQIRQQASKEEKAMTPSTNPELTELLDLVKASTLLHDAHLYHSERHVNLLIEVLLYEVNASGTA